MSPSPCKTGKGTLENWAFEHAPKNPKIRLIKKRSYQRQPLHPEPAHPSPAFHQTGYKQVAATQSNPKNKQPPQRPPPPNHHHHHHPPPPARTEVPEVLAPPAQKDQMRMRFSIRGWKESSGGESSRWSIEWGAGDGAATCLRRPLARGALELQLLLGRAARRPHGRVLGASHRGRVTADGGLNS
jgi:hypothetical protein